MFISKKLFEYKIKEAQDKVYHEVDEIRFQDKTFARFDEMETKIHQLQESVVSLQKQILELQINQHQCHCENK